MENRVQACRVTVRQIPLSESLRSDGELIAILANLLIPNCQEKLLARQKVPVPKTDTGRRGENPKVRGRTLVKELGKMSP